MSFVSILTKINEALALPVVQWAFWTIGSIAMVFTPDHIDQIIASILAILGIKAIASASTK